MLLLIIILMESVDEFLEGLRDDRIKMSFSEQIALLAKFDSEG